MCRSPRSARNRARSSGLRAAALVIVVGNVADDLQSVLIKRQEPRLLHRDRASRDRMGVQYAVDFRPRLVHSTRDRKATAVDRNVRGLDLLAVGIDLDQRGGGHLLEQQPVWVDQKMPFRARHARGDAGVDQIRPAEEIDEPVAGREVAANPPFLGRHPRRHCGRRPGHYLLLRVRLSAHDRTPRLSLSRIAGCV